MAVDPVVTAGLVIIFIIVLIGPFRVKIIEENLEVFLFVCGVLALTISGMALIPGDVTGWRFEIVEEALSAPLRIAEVYGIPIGIVQIVLIVGLIIYRWHARILRVISKLIEVLSLRILAFLLIVGLGLLSSIISAILASIILVEVMCALPIDRKNKIALTVIACFSIGLGAALTPLGEPLSTIVTSKLAGAPYHASFTFLFGMIGIYVIPGIVVFGILGVLLLRHVSTDDQATECEVYHETIREVVIRAAKVYVFIMALVFLGDGFKPLILEYILNVPSEALYWVNLVSAVLDNATLAAAEIAPALSELQIKSALMGLLIAGGMLIPGNIPNIIAAGKMRITSREWARLGLPIGVAAMAVYFAVIFGASYVGLA